MVELSTGEKKLLRALLEEKKATPEQALKASGLESEQDVISSAGWLQVKGLATIDEQSTKIISLADGGIAYHEKGLPERRALRAIADGVETMGDLAACGALENHEISIAIGWLKKKGWAQPGKKIELTDAGREAIDVQGADEALIAKLSDGEHEEDGLDADALKQLRSRQTIVKEREIISREITLTDAGRTVAGGLGDIDDVEAISQLTPELIKNWEREKTRVTLKKYDVHVPVAARYGGKSHPLRQIIDEIREIFLQMGFSEIDGPFVESCFWDMDALFVPQDHPAREMQDTFYLKNPKKMPINNKRLTETIKNIHDNGGDTGSLGWQYAWSKDEAERALLRTHTTVNTIKYLSKQPNPPVKVFSVGRVFRKETIDFSHLPEFHQVEGIILEEKASLRMLIGILTEFYHRMGFKKVRVRPSYFPYTEPSLEVETYFEDRGQWLELGGAGMYRPEVTAPFGIQHPVLAWGLGLERLAMLRLGLTDIRDLYISDITWLRKSPLRSDTHETRNNRRNKS